MPIYKPGDRYRYSRILHAAGGKRPVVALLSLTAMVDMFTVLVIFLLQNFDPSAENKILPFADQVKLPAAESTKELKPAHVITISEKEISLDQVAIVSFAQVKGQEDWTIQPLFDQLKKALEKGEKDFKNTFQQKLKGAVSANKSDVPQEDPDAWKKITIQADKGVDFLTVKKVMYTATEAGGGELNFAVTKKLGSN